MRPRGLSPHYNRDLSRPLYTSYDEAHSDRMSACLVYLTTFTVALPSRHNKLTPRVTATLLCFRQQRRRSSSRPPPPPSRPPPPRRHNFVVSVITFEGPKLRFSNLTHALLIQISRTSSIIDIVVPSKMATGGYFVKKIQQQVPDRSEMARNEIESDFWTSKNGCQRPFCQN